LAHFLSQFMLGLTFSVGLMASPVYADPAQSTSGIPPATKSAPDPMVPTSNVASAFASPLRVLTIVTADLEQTRRFYQGAMGMVATRHELKGQAARALRRHWNMADGLSLTSISFSQPGAIGSMQVRAILADPDAPSSRPNYDPEYPGALGMGYPIHDLARRETIVAALGFRSAVGVVSMAFPRADQTTYDVGEIHFKAPDDILVLGVDRADMAPVGPLDRALDIGGPAYASAIITDAEAIVPIFSTVLGLEMRREMSFQSGGPSGGMGLPEKTKVRFQQWFSPGSTTAYLVIMDLIDAGKTNRIGLGPASRGLAMWTFDVPSLKEVGRRARLAGVTILSPPSRQTGPDGKPQYSMMLATPDNFPIEVVQNRSR
jgi:catechol 2,3-dioxygenase-like lactoylglutathione lyase family enzyme